jgi:hypothetical protein
MTCRLRAVLLNSVVLVAVLSLVAPAVASACECDSPHLRHHGAVIKVFPTHRDDTANLRCALRVAEREPGHTIELAAGQFWTRQLWAAGFVGTLKGQGADKTVLSNRGPLHVSTAEDVILNPPSASNPWPSFLTFVDGDFTVSDLGIRMKGPQLTAPWSSLGMIFENVITGEIVVTGSHADASFERLAIEGATVAEGYAAPHGEIVSIFFQPILGGWAKPLSGSFTVIGCTFRNVAMGFNAIGIEHGQLTWHANRVLDSGAGFEVWDSSHTILEATNNEIEATGYSTGSDFPYPAIYVGGNFLTGLGLKSSTLLIADNKVTATAARQYGITVDPDVFEQNHVIVVGNDLSAAGRIYLGPHTTGCIVEKDGATVVDDAPIGNNYVLTP